MEEQNDECAPLVGRVGWAAGAEVWLGRSLAPPAPVEAGASGSSVPREDPWNEVRLLLGAKPRKYKKLFQITVK